MFTTMAPDRIIETFPTKADAIAYGNGLNVESFEVWDEDLNACVYSKRPTMVHER